MDVEQFGDLEDGKAFLVTIPERRKKIKVHVPSWKGYCLWEICYEDGTPIPELDGKYTTQKYAMDAVEKWSSETKKTEAAKHAEIFADKPKTPPVLKMKKVKQIATEAETNSTDDLLEGTDN